VPQSGATARTSLLRRASFSLAGHVALGEMAVGLPLTLLFLYQNYTQGTLTFQWALWVIFLGFVAGLIWAVIFWYTVSRPLIRRRRARSDEAL
jgi:peptidoglycan/LPS O-acetylase OafA/YrhL